LVHDDVPAPLADRDDDLDAEREVDLAAPVDAGP
jgi:hypothetical protein